jgi:hypothetical protein
VSHRLVLLKLRDALHNRQLLTPIRNSIKFCSTCTLVIGHRKLMLNGRRIVAKSGGAKLILLTMEKVRDEA